MAVKEDLPITFYDAATLLDPNAGYFLRNTNIPTSQIYVEKYVTKKGAYEFLPIGTASQYHPNAFLYAEEDFTDIGGGLMTFNRKYSAIPEGATEIKSANMRTGRITGYAAAGGNANFIGGDLQNGTQEIQNDTVNIQNASTQTVYADVLTSFLLTDEIKFDQSSEIMNVKKEELVTKTVTYERVRFESRVISTGVGGLGYWKVFRFPEEVTKQVTVNNGSTFPKGTVFRRELVGRYLGNIFEIREYAIHEDLVLKEGKVQSGDTLTINIT